MLLIPLSLALAISPAGCLFRTSPQIEVPAPRVGDEVQYERVFDMDASEFDHKN